MAEFGEYALTCPVCRAPVVLPLTQSGADLHSITLAIDLGALRRHIATAHPQEPSMASVFDRFHGLVTTLESEGHHLTDEARAVFDRYEKEAAAVVNGMKPLLGDFETNVVRAVENALAAGKLDAEAFAKAVAAEVAKILGNAPAPAPAEPPAAN